MTSSASASAAAAASHVTHLHINTAAAPAASTLTSQHSPGANAARSPQSATSSPRAASTTTTTGGGGGGGSGSTNQACAACKYQRRKCNPDCPLAPYFPADQQRRFLNAHRLFGVSNILKTLRRLSPELCADAMGTLIYQSDMRAQDPVGGCYRLILSYERQLEIDTAELSAVLHNLAVCRQAAAAATAVPPPPPQQQQGAAGGMPDLDVTSSNQPLLLNAEQEVVDALYANHEAETAILQADDDVHRHDQGHSPQQADHGEQQQQQQLFDYFYYDATASDDASSKPTIDINLDGMQQFDDFEADQKEGMPEPEAPEGLGQLDVNCQIDDKDDYYQIKAASLVDVFEMRQELHADIDVNAVDVNADDIDVKAVVDVNAGIGIDVNAVDINADIDVNGELQDGDAKNNIPAGEAAQMAESSHCRLGLGFSSF